MPTERPAAGVRLPDLSTPGSYPQRPLHARTATPNSGQLTTPTPRARPSWSSSSTSPGSQPFVDVPSCAATHLCAALTIDIWFDSQLRLTQPGLRKPLLRFPSCRQRVPAGPPSRAWPRPHAHTRRESLLMTRCNEPPPTATSGGLSGQHLDFSSTRPSTSGWPAARRLS